ncbi:MAG: hypothetical protein M5R36_23790 [Deltaproteobacteria bacterium]|nr:hypothetical protein [Deltaproteobacteria bacterium]
MTRIARLMDADPSIGGSFAANAARDLDIDASGEEMLRAAYLRPRFQTERSVAHARYEKAIAGFESVRCEMSAATATGISRTSPPWYYGFTDDTSVTLDLKTDRPLQNARIVFGGNAACRPIHRFALADAGRQPYTVSIARRIPVTDFFNYDHPLGKILSFLMEQMADLLDPDYSGQLHRSALLVQIESPEFERCGGNADVLDDIVIEPLGDSEMVVHGAHVVLNKMDILKTTFHLGRRATSVKPLSLADRKKLWCWYQAWGKYAPTEPIPEIINQASRDYGQLWSSKYPAKWLTDTTPRGNITYWKATPLNWCSEFASWAIRNGSNLSTPHVQQDGIGDNLDTWEMAGFFCTPQSVDRTDASDGDRSRMA